MPKNRRCELTITEISGHIHTCYWMNFLYGLKSSVKGNFSQLRGLKR